MRVPSLKLCKNTYSEIMLCDNLYSTLNSVELLFTDKVWKRDIKHETCSYYPFILALTLIRKQYCALPSSDRAYRLIHGGLINVTKQDL
jgi:hypothetical protein